ncbi:hypothetical protein FAIPA1_310009 [Frankia sp. AiPs1]
MVAAGTVDPSLIITQHQPVSSARHKGGRVLAPSRRVLPGVRLVTSDAHRSLMNAIVTTLPVGVRRRVPYAQACTECQYSGHLHLARTYVKLRLPGGPR